MIKALGILKVVLSIVTLTFAPFLFFGSLSPASEGNIPTLLSIFLVFFGCYLFYSGQTQFMKLNVKHPSVIIIGAISGIIMPVALIYFNNLNGYAFLVFSVIIAISIQDIFRIKNLNDTKSSIDSQTLDDVMKD